MIVEKKALNSILKYAALSESLKTKDYRILLYLMPKLKKGEFITINHGKIADDLQIAKTDVSRSIRKLIGENIICPYNTGTGWKTVIKIYPYTYDQISRLILQRLYEDDEEDYYDEDE